MIPTTFDPDTIPRLRETLRSSTHDAHVRLNHHPLLVGLTRPGYLRFNYWQVLVAYHHFYQAVEAAIENYLGRCSSGFDYQLRRKRFWLLEDLACGGIDPTAAHWQPVAGVASVVIEDLAQLVGVLYLIEGATLGGQVISRHIQAGLEMAPEHGGRFFHAYGELTAVRWQEFLKFAEQACDTAAKRERAVQTATRMFCRVEEILNEYATRSPTRSSHPKGR